MTEPTKILGKSYDNAESRNFLRKSHENLTKKLRIAYRKVSKLTYENLRKILGILKLCTCDKVTTDLGKLRKFLGRT